MRSLAETCTRWDATFAHSSNLSDLKLSVRNERGHNPCDVGLRSVCWKAFLLFENLDRSTWSKTLRDSRSAYTSLREHFLRDIEHPDDLSAADPLADDQNSPWNILRRDEILRDEIYQDVERCMPENLYFREPTTQSRLLDILFIFCKLNADIGYRQGMHEVLAPILWVISRDAIDPASLYEQESTDGHAELLREALDNNFVEHDAFTLFCVIMQTVKAFYEMSSNSPQASAGSQSSSPIVERSQRIHEVYLRKADPELTQHLTDIEILPQIFVIRWIRLLFGREFPFEDVLCLWDILFAEDPALELVDFVCMAMLLRVRWQLMEADYTSALTLLLRYPPPSSPYGPSTFVEDALYLRQNLSFEGGSFIISKYSGRPPLMPLKPPRGSSRRNHIVQSNPATPKAPNRPRSPIRSPARFIQDQGGIEGILQEAAKGVYSRGEKWGVNKALRGAVQGLQSGNSSPRRLPIAGVRWSLDDGKSVPSDNDEQLRERISTLEQRNKGLAKMMEHAIEDLWLQQKSLDEEKKEAAANAISLAIAKLQFVQVYLEDSSMPLVPEVPASVSIERIEPAPAQTQDTKDIPVKTKASPTAQDDLRSQSTVSEATVPPATVPAIITPDEEKRSPDSPALERAPPPQSERESAPASVPNTVEGPPLPKSKPEAINERPGPSPFHHPRPSLAQSSFSWMLGPDQRKSSFVSASPFPPEKKRESAARGKAGFLFGEEESEASGAGSLKAKEKHKGRDKQKGKERDGGGGDGFTLGTLRGLPGDV